MTNATRPPASIGITTKSDATLEDREIVSVWGGPSMIVKLKSAASLRASGAMFSRAMLTTWKPVSGRKLAQAGEIATPFKFGQNKALIGVSSLSASELDGLKSVLLAFSTVEA